jgi:hypothetical protein
MLLAVLERGKEKRCIEKVKTAKATYKKTHAGYITEGDGYCSA